MQHSKRNGRRGRGNKGLEKTGLGVPGVPPGSVEETAIDPAVLQVLGKLLKHQPDAQEKLQDIVRIVLGTSDLPVEEARKALDQAVGGYETRLRVGLVAVAQEKLERTARLAVFLHQLEDMIFDPAALAGASLEDLFSYYGSASKILTQDLTFIERVVEMRLRAIGIAGVMNMAEDIDEGKNIINVDGEEVTLGSTSRDRVRKILTSILARE